VTRPERSWGPEQKGFLLALRDEGDRPADDAVAASDNPWFDPADLRGDTPETAAWIDDHFGADRPARPEWVDDDLLDEGRSFFDRQPWAVNVAFLLGSLPMSYGAAVGAGVVHAGRLASDPKRRVFETALLIEELTEPDGLSDGLDGRPLGRGYVTILRLRLLHAAVRRAAVDRGWDRGRDGCPVSQLDLLGTLWCFSLSSAHALRQAGRQVGERELEGWVHLWCLIGHHLGIRPDLLPMGVDEARRCFDAIQWVQFGPSAAGTALTRALIGVGHDLVPFDRFDGLVEALIRRNIGDEYAGMLGVPDVGEAPLRWAERFWHLATNEEAPEEGEEPPERVADNLLLWLCRHLADLEDEEVSARSPEATRRLLDVYAVTDLLQVRKRLDELEPGFGLEASRPRVRRPRPEGGATGS
jgi:hypothetical protein